MATEYDHGTAERNAKIVEYRDMGKSWRWIAKQFSLTHQRIIQIYRQKNGKSYHSQTQEDSYT